MVVYDGVKYACERCIRGHRVTACTHVEQTLFPIKPKGRPPSLCPSCREAKKNRLPYPTVDCSCPKTKKKKPQKSQSSADLPRLSKVQKPPQTPNHHQPTHSYSHTHGHNHHQNQPHGQTLGAHGHGASSHSTTALRALLGESHRNNQILSSYLEASQTNLLTHSIPVSIPSPADPTISADNVLSSSIHSVGVDRTPSMDSLTGYPHPPLSETSSVASIASPGSIYSNSTFDDFDSNSATGPWLPLQERQTGIEPLSFYAPHTTNRSSSNPSQAYPPIPSVPPTPNSNTSATNVNPSSSRSANNNRTESESGGLDFPFLPINDSLPTKDFDSLWNTNSSAAGFSRNAQPNSGGLLDSFCDLSPGSIQTDVHVKSENDSNNFINMNSNNANDLDMFPLYPLFGSGFASDDSPPNLNPNPTTDTVPGNIGQGNLNLDHELEINEVLGTNNGTDVGTNIDNIYQNNNKIRNNDNDDKNNTNLNNNNNNSNNRYIDLSDGIGDNDENGIDNVDVWIKQSDFDTYDLFSDYILPQNQSFGQGLLQSNMENGMKNKKDYYRT